VAAEAALAVGDGLSVTGEEDAGRFHVP
jgi:hypothetical protein